MSSKRYKVLYANRKPHLISRKVQYKMRQRGISFADIANTIENGEIALTARHKVAYIAMFHP